MAVECRLISWVETFCSGAKDFSRPFNAHSCLLTTYLKRSSIPRWAFKPSWPLPRPWSAPSEAGHFRKLQAWPGLELHSPLHPLT